MRIVKEMMTGQNKKFQSIGKKEPCNILKKISKNVKISEIELYVDKRLSSVLKKVRKMGYATLA